MANYSELSKQEFLAQAGIYQLGSDEIHLESLYVEVTTMLRLISGLASVETAGIELRPFPTIPDGTELQ